MNNKHEGKTDMHEEALYEYKQRRQIDRDFVLSFIPSATSGLFLYASETVKALILVNAGAAAALLALIGHLVTTGNKSMTQALALPLCAFPVSSLLVCAGMGFSYLSQLKANEVYMLLYFYKTEEEIRKYNSMRKWAALWQFLAVIAIALSFVTCLVGIWTAYKAFMGF